MRTVTGVALVGSDSSIGVVDAARCNTSCGRVERLSARGETLSRGAAGTAWGGGTCVEEGSTLDGVTLASISLLRPMLPILDNTMCGDGENRNNVARSAVTPIKAIHGRHSPRTLFPL